ncbi:hypothetical protein C4K88_15190 [Arthrobacter pityocampae]|uniref:Uncharacterized protein n=1 Tax=Arthrobacter pityocampae TaxID=547334 RepID=A0A2S5IUQ9_9MICC|nr:hypothetical protein [Arthrobacter pityocampae]PPB48294.1 hypothetical protein C4K88_15190 [Arthrobacter pityocampae]
MSASFDITRVNDNEYRVRTEAEGQSVESLFRMNPDLQGRLGGPEADEVAVVEATARFLSRHQSVIDFPPMIDLEDILATYDDAPEQIQRLLADDSPGA